MKRHIHTAIAASDVPFLINPGGKYQGKLYSKAGRKARKYSDMYNLAPRYHFRHTGGRHWGGPPLLHPEHFLNFGPEILEPLGNGGNAH